MSLPSIPSFILSGLLLIRLPFSSFASATTSHISFSYAARQWMQDRTRLLKQYQTHLKKQASYIVEGNVESKKALRQRNRGQIKQHPEQFPAPLKASGRHWQALAENNHFLSSDHLHNITEVVIRRLEQQLGRLYVWGGTRSGKGFDCSGLAFYAYNKTFEVKPLRMTNEMYHYHRATIVANNSLRRRDLLFFYIHNREITDHMGVYLGDEQFIESPRIGETTRISRLAEPFWQDYFLGTHRTLVEETVLQDGQDICAASGSCAQVPDAMLARLIMSTSPRIFVSRFPDIKQPHCRPFPFFLPLRERSRHV